MAKSIIEKPESENERKWNEESEANRRAEIMAIIISANETNMKHEKCEKKKKKKKINIEEWNKNK